MTALVQRSVRFSAIVATVIILAACGATSPGPSPSPASKLIIDRPAAGTQLTASPVEVMGHAPGGARVVHDIPLSPDQEVTATADGTWSLLVVLKEGVNDLVVRVGDDKSTAIQLTLTYTPMATPTPAATPVPTLALTPTTQPTATPTVSVTYTTTTLVGGSIFVNVKITNTGEAATAPIRLGFGGLKDYADLVGCIPACSQSGLLGDIYTQFQQGVGAGKTVTFKVEFLAKKVGVANWTLQVAGNMFSGTGRTAIR